MNPVRKGIVSTLAAYGPLTSLLSSQGAIYYRKAPRSAHTPYVIINKQSGADQPLFAGASITYEGWLIKAVDRNTSPSKAEDIAEQIHAAINGKILNLDGGGIAAVNRQSHVDYEEADGDEAYQNVGAVYRVVDP